MSARHNETCRKHRFGTDLQPTRGASVISDQELSPSRTVIETGWVLLIRSGARTTNVHVVRSAVQKGPAERATSMMIAREERRLTDVGTGGQLELASLVIAILFPSLCHIAVGPDRGSLSTPFGAPR